MPMYQRVWHWRLRWFLPKRRPKKWKPRAQKTVHVVGLEDVQAVVWKRRSGLGHSYSVSVHQRCFWRSKREYRHTMFIDEHRIALAVMALELAHTWIGLDKTKHGS